MRNCNCSAHVSIQQNRKAADTQLVIAFDESQGQ